MKRPAFSASKALLPVGLLLVAFLLTACAAQRGTVHSDSSAPADEPTKRDAYVIDRADYADRLHGFWLGQSIANWTGLSTEMVKVAPPFFTDADWGKLGRAGHLGTLCAAYGSHGFLFAGG